jgi:putative endopeptidase
VTYNKWSFADFSLKAPGLDWNAYLESLGVQPSTTPIVLQPSAFTGEARIRKETPLATLQGINSCQL